MAVLHKEVFLKDLIDMVQNPEMFAGSDPVTFSILFFMVYEYWVTCLDFPPDHTHKILEELSARYEHGPLVFGSKFSSVKEVASVCADLLFDMHGIDV